MKRIHKLLYSCFSFVLTLAYRNEAGADYSCTYTVLSTNPDCGNNEYVSLSSYYTSARTALSKMEANTKIEMSSMNICSGGTYVDACYTENDKSVKYLASEMQDNCSYYRADCLPCPHNGFVEGTARYICNVSSKSYSFLICSAEYMTGTASISGSTTGAAKLYSYVCYNNCSDYNSTIKLQKDCFIHANSVVTEDSGRAYEFVSSCYYTGTN